MPYLGEIPQANGYSFVVTDAPSKLAVTVFNIRRDRISEVESLAFVPDQSAVINSGPRTIASNVGRIVLVASLTSGSATLSIAGRDVVLGPDATITFDVMS